MNDRASNAGGRIVSIDRSERPVSLLEVVPPLAGHFRPLQDRYVEIFSRFFLLHAVALSSRSATTACCNAR